MSRYLPEPPHRHGTPSSTAILIVNLGTPDEASAPALRRYLKEFLSDPRVVEIPKAIWWLILNGIILNIRPKKSAAKYASVWMKEGSPLRVHTERQAKLLKGLLGERGHHVTVDWAMRYGTRSVPEMLAHLKANGATRILLVPMYPQYAASTTATVVDEACRWLLQLRNQPEMRFVRNFHDDEGYLAALETSVRQHWQTAGPLGPDDRLLISFHGLPKRSLDLGDPYFCECHKTGRLLAERLQLKPEQYRLCFQSRFGKAEWLQPYTAPTLHALGKEGTKRLDVICPGFTADCLETLEEIALEGRDDFIAAGGQAYHYIPALNEDAAWIAALANLVERQLGGWDTRQPFDPRQLEIGAREAFKHGART
ncbi:ferrochelatase [Dechloromonas denitrificans]|uniref:ferrochelatase n=1 Tax=Dechloromonas denitrificans TaxID=281362 RepID=UPI001CF912BD|nr:ferrochelatase [Dechloromonas denitrificans]UCV10774.1 ferrochelatase [Dechloromonas denitrificans]